jgi:hypothetical protein
MEDIMAQNDIHDTGKQYLVKGGLTTIAAFVAFQIGNFTFFGRNYTVKYVIIDVILSLIAGGITILITYLGYRNKSK